MQKALITFEAVGQNACLAPPPAQGLRPFGISSRVPSKRARPLQPLERPVAPAAWQGLARSEAEDLFDRLAPTWTCANWKEPSGLWEANFSGRVLVPKN